MRTTYSRMDRILHYAAFNAMPAQIVLADMERSLFRGQFVDIPVRKPVFITALPRAGTTVLLYILAELQEFATHTYRDMPFVLMPLLWQRLSSQFRKDAVTMERAHGDGLSINYDSPEAFEEIVWKAHWSEHYQPDRIIPWTPDLQPTEFRDFLSDHMRKIISLRTEVEDKYSLTRYLSKNNANIARLRLLLDMFPDARILIPFRHPWHHAESLRRQHIRFSQLHASDSFSRRYMEWLGHYEFGGALKPIDFNNWLAASDRLDPAQTDFWLSYWRAAYSAIQDTLLSISARESIVLIDYDELCAAPTEILPSLAEQLELNEPHRLVDKASHFKPARTYEHAASAVSEFLYSDCESLYVSLRKQCLTGRMSRSC